MAKPITSPFRTATIDGALRIVYAGTSIPGDGRAYTRAEALAVFLDMRRVDLLARAKRDGVKI